MEPSEQRSCSKENGVVVRGGVDGPTACAAVRLPWVEYGPYRLVKFSDADEVLVLPLGTQG